MHKKEKSVFFNYMDFQIIKGHVFDKAVLVEPGFGMLFEFGDILVQPDRVAQVKPAADIFQPLKYFPGSVKLLIVVADYRIL